MALDAGELTLVLEFAQGLKDKDWFGKQDPYVVLTCGSHTLKSRTAQDGGTSPVWNETFKFNVINENSVSFTIKDQDTFKDDVIGTGHLQLAKAREHGADRMQVPVMSKDGRKQHGHLQVSLTFTRNSALARPQQIPQQQAAPYGYPPQKYSGPYGAPPLHGYAVPPASAYGAPSYTMQAPHFGGAPAPVYAAYPPPGYVLVQAPQAAPAAGPQQKPVQKV